MINITDLRSARLDLSLKELSILNAIKLAKMPSHLNEKQNTFLIKSVVESVKGNADPKYWTIQERLFTISHYIASTQDGNPDFELGNARYSDYLQGEKQYQYDHLELGEYSDDFWTAIPLLGVMSEAIERLYGEIEGLDGEAHWQVGCMAAQMIPNGDALDHTANDYESQLLKRMCVFSLMAESDFIHFLSWWNIANEHFTHLFKIALSDEGIVICPADREGGANLPYARFPARIAITPVARYLSGKPESIGP